MRYILIASVVSVSLCGSLPAATISLDPVSGNVDAQPGQLAGWGFTILNDSAVYWISFTGSLTIGETNPSVGLYTDFIGPQGGPVGASLQPLTTWTETFSDPAQIGVGEFLIDPGAPAGAQDSGSIRVMWEQFAGDPASCGCIPSSFSQDLPFQVTVDSAAVAGGAPEPGTVWLTAIAGLLVCAGYRMLRWAANCRYPRR